VSTARFSHARAMAHCRFTVAGDIPTTSAVSSTVRPPKYRSSTMRACSGSKAARRGQRLVECEHVDAGWLGRYETLVERHPVWSATAFCRLAGARPLHEDLPHRQALRWRQSADGSRRDRGRSDASRTNASLTSAVACSVCPGPLAPDVARRNPSELVVHSGISEIGVGSLPHFFSVVRS
jgi:hypothetical protein